LEERKITTKRKSQKGESLSELAREKVLFDLEENEWE